MISSGAWNAPYGSSGDNPRSRVRLPTKDGGNAVRLSGTIFADCQGWWKCSKIVWNNLC
ncbi:MAG: hypothetical protein HFP77_00355 [Methylococcales symbiont of Iophon sp. n. MRB-2018]|nr:MAG: hypothetical protein HFP77_00355 [Methylococcales symbiont of Iophon sp. n. MRB-2018]KAF3979509.1 MAG: hypothetical protein HFP76_06755 [Methylococcales symbiont of Iophon sp. n. MRB-2018]